MKNRTQLFFLLIPLLLIAIVILRITRNKDPRDTRRLNFPIVRAGPVRIETITQGLQLIGDVSPIQQAEVFAKVYGNLEEVRANIGDFVQKNQLLAVIDTTELAQQYRQALATYQNADSVFKRTEILRQKNLVAQQDVDNAVATKKVAQEDLDAAQTRLDYAQITAPFSGYITHRFLDAGALVTATNASLFNLMKLDSVKALVEVLEKDVPLVKVGDTADVTVDAYPGKKFAGLITRMSQDVNLDTRTMEVEIDIANRDLMLKPGMFANVTLVLSRHQNAVTVPTQAVLQDPSGYHAFIVEKNLARRKVVTIGSENESRVEILSGLKPGDSVIIVGQQFVHDSGKVQIQP